MLTAFYEDFRVNELVCSSRKDVSNTALQMGDVEVFEDRVVIHLRRSRTDQFGKG